MLRSKQMHGTVLWRPHEGWVPYFKLVTKSNDKHNALRYIEELMVWLYHSFRSFWYYTCQIFIYHTRGSWVLNCLTFSFSVLFGRMEDGAEVSISTSICIYTIIWVLQSKKHQITPNAETLLRVCLVVCKWLQVVSESCNSLLQLQVGFAQLSFQVFGW